MSSPQQSVETKKKDFAKYRIFGFWLANHLKDEGLIDVETCGKLIGAQKTFEAKDAQEEFYGKFFAALPDVTKDLRELAKSSIISEKQGIEINKWGKNVYVKVPVVNSKNKFTGKVIQELNNKNIKLNITAVYTAAQTAKILKKINKKTKVIISIFAGRAGDVGKDPVPEFVKSIKMAKRYKNVEILWASVREPYNYLQAKQLGCHIITIPPKIIEKIEKFGKTFDQLTKETVKNFLIDSKKSNFKI